MSMFPIIVLKFINTPSDACQSLASKSGIQKYRLRAHIFLWGSTAEKAAYISGVQVGSQIKIIADLFCTASVKV